MRSSLDYRAPSGVDLVQLMSRVNQRGELLVKSFIFRTKALIVVYMRYSTKKTTVSCINRLKEDCIPTRKCPIFVHLIYFVYIDCV